VLEAVNDPGQAAEAGRALGAFHRRVRDLSPARLTHTLPGFHVTPAYLERLTDALQSGGAACHTPELRTALRRVAARRAEAGVLEAARAAGSVPERVVHGDPKLGNILFDRDGRRALALIDLDTVQPGLALYDLGDCLRSCCNRAGESPAGEPAAVFDLALCEPLLGAYAAETRGLLTAAEVALIPEAAWLIPFELGVRFLTDHLEGDQWFRVAHPGQNLHRALVQLALAEDAERRAADIRRIVESCFGGAAR
jgi:Ser/Thr protein kinase RdoA (MazF antagonist)